MIALALLLAQSYSVEGLVLAVDRGRQTLLVSHKEIPGVMPAMAMPFRAANPKDLSGVTPGMLVRFDMRQGVARKLRVMRTDRSFEQDGRKVPIPVPPNQVAIGSAVPDFTLPDHAGGTFQLSAARGKLVVVQFLYTRCPLPEVCPRLAATFARLQRRFDGRGVILLTVTLDPRYDTVEVLSRYAGFYRARAENWQFLTGSEDQIRDVAGRFGIAYWPEDGVITHTSTIGIIGRTGKLETLVEGLGFTAQQLGDLVEHHLKQEGQ